jgi:methylated-DNA-protein-cysteine methyltransferase-like protein
MADGSITGGSFADMRRAILEDEGVLFLPDGRVDMSICRWLG